MVVPGRMRMKEMVKLTAKTVENAQAKNKEYKLNDGNGLYLRVRTTGSKSWIFCFHPPGERKLITMTIGSLKDLSLKEARSKLPELRKLVVEGTDPRRARAAAKAENLRAITMQMLFDDWVKFLVVAKKATPDWIKRQENRWRLHLKKPLGNFFVKDVTRAHLASALDIMIRKGIKEETRKALTILNLMLDHALTRHSIEQNPARMLKPKDFAVTASRPCNRALSLSELRELWLALDQTAGSPGTTKMSEITRTVIKILILTGARRGEVVGMQWSELDLSEAIWNLPPSRVKNRQAHTIYLSRLALTLLEALKPVTGGSPFVFNTEHKTESGHIHKDVVTGAIRRLQVRAKANPNKSFLQNINSFTIHDLRRSAATAWGEHLKVSPHIIERMLNHQPLDKLIATYQRAVYAEEQKAAWMAWGELVERRVANKIDNVVPLKKVKEAMS